MSVIDPPDPGYLLKELGYDDEIEAAVSLGIEPKTMSEYRKQGIGPAFTEVARRILYSRKAREEWLAAGGTRAAENAAAQVTVPRKSTRETQLKKRAGGMS